MDEQTKPPDTARVWRFVDGSDPYIESEWWEAVMIGPGGEIFKINDRPDGEADKLLAILNALEAKAALADRLADALDKSVIGC